MRPSRYQSQTSFQTKPYSSLTRFENWNVSNSSVATRVTSFSRVRIQRSIGSVAGRRRQRAVGSAPSSTSRDAFQSLFVNARPSSSMPSAKRTSCVEAHLQEAVAGGVGAVAVDQVERVDAGAERLRHPPPVGRLDGGVDVDVGERDVAGELDAGEDHPRHPEVDDVARRRQHVARVPAPQRRRVVGPAERRVRPQRGREPRVEHVGRLLPAVAVGPLALHDVAAVRREPDRQPVAPPQLARDAPGADRLHPVEEDLLEPLRVERDAAAAHRLHRRLRELVHLAEPLQRHQRLDARAGALAEADRVVQRLLAHDPALGAQLRERRRRGPPRASSPPTPASGR